MTAAFTTSECVMSHIEKCRNLYYATLKVPKALHQKLGRTKFKKSLGTADKRRAQVLAAPLVAMWQATLRQAEGEADAVQLEALRWRAALAAEKVAGDADRVELLESLLADKATNLEVEKGEEVAARFADVALGLRTPSPFGRAVRWAQRRHAGPRHLPGERQQGDLLETSKRLKNVK